MDKSLHQKVWDILQSIPKGGRTEYICKCILAKEQSDNIADVVYKSVKKVLAEQGRMPERPAELNKPKTREAEEIKKNLFGFMASLQNTHQRKEEDKADTVL